MDDAVCFRNERILCHKEAAVFPEEDKFEFNAADVAGLLLRKVVDPLSLVLVAACRCQVGVEGCAGVEHCQGLIAQLTVDLSVGVLFETLVIEDSVEVDLVAKLC